MQRGLFCSVAVMAEKTPLQLVLMIEALERRIERLERDVNDIRVSNISRDKYRRADDGRIEVLEHSIERLEAAAKITRRKLSGDVSNARRTD